MRNSFLPIIGVFLVTVLALWMIPHTNIEGQDGPQIHSGILRLPKKIEKMVPSADVPSTVTLTRTAVGEFPPGIEPQGWRVVGIALDDVQPLTRAVALGLGERLTLMNVVVLFDVVDDPVLPSPPDRIIRIRTVSGGTPDPATHTITGVLEISQEEIRLPEWHPAAGLQGALRLQPITWSVTVNNTVETPGSWSQRWAAIGRDIGNAVLADLGITDRVPKEWDRYRPTPPEGRWIPYFFIEPSRLWLLFIIPIFLTIRLWAGSRLPEGHRGRRPWARRRPWIIAVALTAVVIVYSGPHRVASTAKDVPLSSWSTHLPLPPNLEVLRWQGCFEDDLVRGWVGRINTKITYDRMSRPISADQPLLKLLSKRQADDGSARELGDGLWREEASPIAGSTLFGRSRQDIDEFIMVIPDDQGWGCVLWQEQPKANSIHDSWLDAAAQGDHIRIARQKLRRHLLTPRIPEDQQQAAIALLRQDPDAAEVAMLGQTLDARVGEQQFAATARWVLGRGERPAAIEGARTWANLGLGEPVVFDGRPILVGIGDDAAGLAMIGPDHDGELYVRSGGQRLRTAIETEKGGWITIPDGPTLVCTPGVAGWQLTRR